MKIFYISSQLVEEIKAAGVVQMLYTAREFQRKLGDNFVFVVRRVTDKSVMEKEGIAYQESGCPFRARILYYLVWLPIFWIKHGKDEENRILYCLDWHVAIAAILYKKFFGYKIAIEYHDPPFSSWKDYIIVRFCDYLLPTTNAMKEYLEKINKRAGAKMCVAPNGIDLERFGSVPSREGCRDILGLPHNKKIILYSGNFVERKGIYVLSDAVSLIKDNVMAVFVGGTDPNSITEFKKRVGDRRDILIVGYRPHEEIPYWIGASDVAVVPNSAKRDTWQGEAAVKWTSPMKIFEYMAGKRPIVVSDIPAVREILSESSAVFVESDDPEMLAGGIEEAIKDQEKSRRIVENAFSDVSHHTWQERSERILNFVSK